MDSQEGRLHVHASSGNITRGTMLYQQAIASDAADEWWPCLCRNIHMNFYENQKYAYIAGIHKIEWLSFA